MSLVSELTTIKEDISDGVVANKVSRFAYKQQAYDDNNADGTDNYDVNQDNNIPLGTPTVMKVNQSVIELGWRARASSITRMLMNHFLGRVSYNLNKANDMINSILGDFISYIGQSDGIATLDENGKLTRTEIPKSDVAVNDTNTLFTAKGAFDYTLGSSTGKSWLCKVFGHLFGRIWTQGTGGTSGSPTAFKYADGLWVGGCQYGVWWSENGKAWTQGTSASTITDVTSVDYGNGLWVCGTGTGCWWSEDGKTWTQGTSAQAFYATQVKYANGLWVCTTNSAGFLWSEDGKAWTQGTGGTGLYLRCVDYGNGLWVCGTEIGCWWSEDGKTWTQGTGDNNSQEIYSVKYANGLWVCGAFGTVGMFWSANGKSGWTSGTGYSGRDANYLHYANGLWLCASEQGCWWSEDGKTWTQGTGGNTSITFICVSYANGLWLSGSTGNGCWWSEDGKAWVKAQFFTSNYVRAVSFKDGLWLCGVGNKGFWWSGIDTLIEKGYFAE